MLESPRPPKYLPGRRNRRALVAAVLAAVCVLCGLVALNAYDAGHAEGFARGYDAASVAEALAWRALPKPVCVPAEPVDMQSTCETWWFYHNPPRSETFQADPRGAK